MVLLSLLYIVLFRYSVGFQSVKEVVVFEQELHVRADPYFVVFSRIVDVRRSIQIRPDVVRKTLFVGHKKIHGTMPEHGAMTALPESLATLFITLFDKCFRLFFRHTLIGLLTMGLIAYSTHLCNMLRQTCLWPPLNFWFCENHFSILITYLIL